MTVNELIKKLQALRPDLREKEVRVECPNGLLVSPRIRFELVNQYSFEDRFGTENVESVMIDWKD